MTAEKRILISLDDIVAVGWECPQCHAEYSVPIEKKFRSVAPTCPNCQERMMGETQTSSTANADTTVLEAFLGHMQDLKRRGIGKHLRLELGGEVKLDIKP
jgi:hypothetical protein